MATNRFDVVDIVVFGAIVVISIGIGIYYALSGGKQKTTSEYLVGGRKISYLPVAISLMVSFESSIMMLGMPAEAYVYGAQFAIQCLAFMVAQIMSVFVVVPLLHPLKITSAFEYLEYRFNSKVVRLLGTAMGMLSYCWYMGIVLFGPAVALEAVTGLPQWTSIMTISLVAVIYTSIGGIKAVVWTDVFQAFVMFLGIFSILIKGTIDVGGPKKVWDIAGDGGRLNFFNFNPDPYERHTFFNLFFFTIIRGFGLTFNQSTVQRISCTKSVGEAKRVLWIVAPAYSTGLLLAVYEGIVAYSYYQTKQCDPFESKQLTNPNQIMPYFVMDIFHNLKGMPGLFLASLFSASLSTLSSGLSSMSAMLWEDIVHPLVGEISDFKGAVIAKISVLVFGLMACGLAFLVSLVGGTLTQIAGSVLSAFGGPVTALFLMGCFCHRATAKGAMAGGILGLALSCWISFGMNFSSKTKKTPWLTPASTEQCPSDGLENVTSVIVNMTTTALTTITTESITTSQTKREGLQYIYDLSYTSIGAIGIVSTIFSGWVFSLLTGPNKPGDVDPRYLLAFSDSILIFMPRSFRKWFGSFGAQFIKEEYKAKFPDPAMKSVFYKEMPILPDDEKVKDELLYDSHHHKDKGNTTTTITITHSNNTNYNDDDRVNGNSSMNESTTFVSDKNGSTENNNNGDFHKQV